MKSERKVSLMGENDPQDRTFNIRTKNANEQLDERATG